MQWLWPSLWMPVVEQGEEVAFVANPGRSQDLTLAVVSYQQQRPGVSMPGHLSWAIPPPELLQSPATVWDHQARKEHPEGCSFRGASPSAVSSLSPAQRNWAILT